MSNRPAFVGPGYNSHPPPFAVCHIPIPVSKRSRAGSRAGLIIDAEVASRGYHHGKQPTRRSKVDRAATLLRTRVGSECSGQGPGARSHIARHAVRRQHATLETAVTAGPQAPKIGGDHDHHPSVLSPHTKEVPSPSSSSRPRRALGSLTNSRHLAYSFSTPGRIRLYVVRPRLTQSGSPARRPDRRVAGSADDMHAHPDLQPLSSGARLWGACPPDAPGCGSPLCQTCMEML